MGKMMGGDKEEPDPDAEKKEEERQEALRQQEEERKDKYAKMEVERESMRQGIRDKVNKIIHNTCDVEQLYTLPSYQLAILVHVGALSFFFTS